MQTLTDKQTATVLAALRYWQDYGQDAPGRSDFFADHPPLTEPEIDELCEALNAGQPVPPQTGIGIYDEDDGLHVCAPFCPKCGTRVYAAGSCNFREALVDAEGWHAGGNDYEDDCVELFGVCSNPDCDQDELSLYFCYGTEEACTS